jgi:hypothetical protein
VSVDIDGDGDVNVLSRRVHVAVGVAVYDHVSFSRAVPVFCAT